MLAFLPLSFNLAAPLIVDEKSVDSAIIFTEIFSNLPSIGFRC
jgi:hypothetical protein